MQTQIIGLSCILSIAAGAIAADPNPGRVFAPPAVSTDERLHVIRDVDHPWIFEPHYSTKAQWEERARQVREQMLVAEGLWPMPERTPLNPVIHGKIERDGYTIEKVYFSSLPGHYVSGSLYRPTGKTGKLPVVLCPHGHWSNGRFDETPLKEARKQIEMGAEKTIESARFILQARCAGLARMGCIVFHYDMVGYADSIYIGHRDGFVDTEATLRLQSFMGLQTWNSIRCIDFVCSLPDVDPARIGVTGASGGGTQTMILSAIDDRPAVSFPAVMVSEAMQGGCICENAPLLRVDTNNAEFAALFAPKPLGMSAANDWTYELEYKGLPQIRDIYKLYGVPQYVAAWHRPFPHNYNQVSRELMYTWMNKHLKLGQSDPVTEKPFVPVDPPTLLSVYDAQHPHPLDSLHWPELRKQMTAASDARMAALAKEPREYRKVVLAALRAMVVGQLPACSDMLVGDDRGVKAIDADVTMQKGTIRRKDRATQVPFVALMPREWNGVVIIWIHPEGKASLFDAQGHPQPAVQKLLAEKSAVLSPDLLLTGEAVDENGGGANPPGKYVGYVYPGYRYGYHRSILASRVDDVLSAIALARGFEGTRTINLVAFGKMGPAALAARALAGDAVARASIDLNHFDFDQVHDSDDEMMLPGALKYGGVHGLASLCATGQTALWNPAPNAPAEMPVKTPEVEIHPGDHQADAILNWISQRAAK